MQVIKKYSRRLVLLFVILALCAGPAWAANTAYYKTQRTGGGASAMDGIDGDTLVDKDLCFVFDGSDSYFYRLDASSGAAESDPEIIAPDLNAGTKRWILQKAYPSELPAKYITGLVPSNNTTDSDHDIDISPGECRDTSDTVDMTLSSTLTKQIDAAWAVGTNAGGLDTGTVAANTIYHVWLIKRSDTGVVDALFSTSGSSPTMPANYDYKRWLGWVRTDSTPAIITADWIGNGNQLEMWFKARQELATGLTATSYTIQSVIGYIPSGITCDALFGGYSTVGGDHILISSDGTNMKTVFRTNSTSTAIGSAYELYHTDYSSPVFVPIISDQIYYKTVNGYSQILLLRAVRYWR